MKKVVITGGHHSSALPVINELKSRYPEIELYWFGHKHSVKGDKNDTLEYKEITDLNIPFFDLKAGKFYKTYDPIRLLKIPYGYFQALALLIKLKPEIVLSFGGYLAVPTVLAAKVLGIPSITHEQTAVLGYANKLIAQVADKVLISWESSREFLKNKNVVFSGLPLREEISLQKTNNFVVNETLPTIYITAGKTGSHIINEVIVNGLDELLKICNAIHQTGDHSIYNDIQKLEERYLKIKDSSYGKYFPKKFIYSDEIGEVYAKASIVVARAGAHTCGELLYLNKPSVLIPIPWVSHKEQQKNAEMLVKEGLAVIINEAELNSARLVSEIKNMLLNITKYQKNTERQLLNSKKIIVDEIEKTYRAKSH